MFAYVGKIHFRPDAGDEILKVLHKSVGPFVEPQNVTVVEKFTAADGESITFTQFNSSKVNARITTRNGGDKKVKLMAFSRCCDAGDALVLR